MSTSEKDAWIRSLTIAFRTDPKTLLDTPYDQFKELLRFILDLHITNTPVIRAYCLYRARIEDPTKPHMYQKDLWYPPEPKNIQHMGRFNKKGEAILYTSGDPITAMIELWRSLGEEDREENKQSGISIHLSEIVPKSGSCTKLNLAHLGMGDNKFFGNASVDNIIADPSMDIAITSQISTPDNPEWINKLSLNAAVNDFLSMICTHNSESAYQFSNEIWQKFKRIPNLDGLMYPSIANGLSAANFAILPSSADRLFRIDNVYKYQIQGSALSADLPCFKELMDQYHVNTGEVDHESGEIKWQLPSAI